MKCSLVDEKLRTKRNERYSGIKRDDGLIKSCKRKNEQKSIEQITLIKWLKI